MARHVRFQNYWQNFETQNFSIIDGILKHKISQLLMKFWNVKFRNYWWNFET